MQIGELAKLCGISTETLRFYEKNKLLKPQARTESGYRQYNQSQVRQVHFILNAKQLGLSLQEIRELLNIRLEASAHSCAEVKQITAKKLLELDQKISALQEIRAALKKINDVCCGHSKQSAKHCSILSALE